MKNKCVVLMPASQYKIKSLYRHVETFELANPKLFEDAVITENLCITTCRKECIDKYNWRDLVKCSLDPSYKKFYDYNFANYHKYGLVFISKNYKPIEYFDINLDFLEIDRMFFVGQGGGFGKNGCGYAWNVLKNGYENKWIAALGQIHFPSKQAKDNFCKYWYSGKRTETLAGKTLLGLHIAHGSGIYFFIPQIDWENIHINQKELWDKELYDEAVLAEMHLKWNEDRTKIIQA